MTRALALCSVAVLTGCFTLKGVYDPGKFPEIPFDPAKRIDGCAIVRTTPEQDAYAWRGGPTGIAGSAGKLEVPLGLIAREGAARAFGGLFRGGAAGAPDGADARACRAVVTPRPTDFAFTVHLRSFEFKMSVWVEARSGAGDVLLSKQYDSGPHRIDASGLDTSATVVAAGAHPVMQALMLRAAADLRGELLRAAPPAGAP